MHLFPVYIVYNYHEIFGLTDAEQTDYAENQIVKLTQSCSKAESNSAYYRVIHCTLKYLDIDKSYYSTSTIK